MHINWKQRSKNSMKYILPIFVNPWPVALPSHPVDHDTGYFAELNKINNLLGLLRTKKSHCLVPTLIYCTYTVVNLITKAFSSPSLNRHKKILRLIGQTYMLSNKGYIICQLIHIEHVNNDLWGFFSECHRYPGSSYPIGFVSLLFLIKVCLKTGISCCIVCL